MPKVLEWVRPPSQTHKRTETDMPVLSKFYGIVIRMVFAQPLVAHFHAIYQDWELVVNVHPVRVVNGRAPVWMQQMVLEWACLHQEELLAAWQSVSQAQAPASIEPLQ